MRSYAQYNSCYILYKVRFPRRFLLPQLVIVANVLGLFYPPSSPTLINVSSGAAMGIPKESLLS